MFVLPEFIVAAAIIAGGMVLSAWILSRAVAAKSAAASSSLPLLPPLPPLPPEAYPVEPSGIPVEPETPLYVGDPVLVNWGGSWWRAQIIDLEPHGRVRIHYVGWEEAFDASVARDELQMDISGSINP